VYNFQKYQGIVRYRICKHETKSLKGYLHVYVVYVERLILPVYDIQEILGNSVYQSPNDQH